MYLARVTPTLRPCLFRHARLHCRSQMVPGYSDAHAPAKLGMPVKLTYAPQEEGEGKACIVMRPHRERACSFSSSWIVSPMPCFAPQQAQERPSLIQVAGEWDAEHSPWFTNECESISLEIVFCFVEIRVLRGSGGCVVACALG